MRGRKPKPLSLLRLSGSKKAVYNRTREPVLLSATPERPSYLSEEAGVCWDEILELLEPMRVVTLADGISLALMAEYLLQWKRATEDLKRYGRITVERDADGKPLKTKTSPWVKMQIDYGVLLFRLMGEFGMTPATRARIETIGASKPKADILFSRALSIG